MARLPRLNPVGVAQHIIQRGNNRQVCFNSDEDLAAYAYWLKEFSVKYSVRIHAWVFMTNHVHLLVTPTEESGLSKMMQSLGRQYVRYFNTTYKRSGTLWEGRFKSCLVQSEDYLLQCYRYIELNPVRAGMVDDPADYKWSSYQANGLGINTSLCTPHEEYFRLGGSREERLSNYRSFFRAHVDSSLIKDIRDSLNRGLVLGNEHFKAQIERNLGRRVRPGKVGRKRKDKILL